MQARTRAMLAWSSWLASFGCCAAGLVVTLLVTRPLTAGVLAEGAAYALAFPLGYATVGLVVSLRRPENPIGWLYAASGLVWSLGIPLQPWVDRLVRDHRPLPLVGQVASVAGSTLALVANSLAPVPLTEVPIDNPFGLAGVAGTVATIVGNAGVVLHSACLPLALICVVLRFRASRGVERQQLRWVAAGAAGAVVGLLA